MSPAAFVAAAPRQRRRPAALVSPGQARERRESERVIAYWARKAAQLGERPTMTSLDLAEIDSEAWAHRFVVAVDRAAENSALLLYGPKFADLLDLPGKTAPHVPMIRQLPKRFAAIFVRGCDDAAATGEPVRIEGSVGRPDGRTELFRAAFISLALDQESSTRFAFGAFNSRVH
jgi:hypothetical protein